MRFQIIGFTLGLLLTILGFAGLVPALMDWSMGHDNAQVFFFNAIVSIFFGGALVITNQSFERNLSLREAFLLTTLSWIFISVFAALPLYMADLDLSYAQAYFEAMSGFTTTGSTVIVGLEQHSKGALIWRSMMQWIGGVGIVAFAIILLPFLRIGGMQLFQTESSDKSDKIMERSNNVVSSLLYVYGFLTLICAVVYYILGMSWFDAVNHAMTTIATGGYSTYDTSFGHYQQPLLHYAASFFMILGGLPFVLFIKFLFQGQFVFWKDDQVRFFLYFVVVLSIVMTSWVFLKTDNTLEESFRYSIFSIVSIITTTGYAIVDYTLWGSFAVVFFLFLTYFGACAGSTSGGIKIMRIVISMKVVSRQFKTLLYPNGVFALTYQEKNIDNAAVLAVLVFLSLYVLLNAILTLALTLVGLDFYTAISGAATAIANVGPGIGSVIGPVGNFSSLPDSALWLLSFGMLMGRLEILTVAVLFSPQFWKN
jgi:trk system potassium uptake protein TrkH